MRYLLITHIPFQKTVDGDYIVDSLWARDLEGMVSSFGQIRVVAPEIEAGKKLKTWGPTSTTIKSGSGVDFVAIATLSSRFDFWKWTLIKKRLKKEVEWADCVQTSNFFPPYERLSLAHDYAVKQGKKTVFVVGEDFYDMLGWEWVRTSSDSFTRWRRERTINRLNRRTEKSASSASLTLLHTPAAVSRYRLCAQNSFAIRQPEHDLEDVISGEMMEAKCATIANGSPLVVSAACRHKALKGLDFLIRAIALLAQTGIYVESKIYGEGEDTLSLKNLASRLSVSDRITFPGALPPGKAIYNAIAESHIFAMAHRTNDFGRAFFDAMAAGSPVVAFRTEASSNTVRDGVDGLLSPMDDVESFAATIKRFHDDRPFLIRVANEARKRALENTRTFWFNLRAGWTKELFQN